MTMPIHCPVRLAGLCAALIGLSISLSALAARSDVPASKRAGADPPVRAAATYARDIAPILNASCVACHREGEVAPFALDSYAQAKRWAAQIAKVTARRTMPP